MSVCIGLKFLVRLCSDMNLKEAEEYANKLKKAEKMQKLREEVLNQLLFSWNWPVTAKFVHCVQKKKTLTFFVVSLLRKLRFAQNFQGCLLGNTYSKNEKVRYSLILVTSC